MDRISPSEGDDTGSIPVRSTTKLLTGSFVVLLRKYRYASVETATNKQAGNSKREVKTEVKTVGNFSFISANLIGLPNGNTGTILGALDLFEKTHPELEILGQPQIEYFELGSSKFDLATKGIWIHHRPKTDSSSIVEK